MISFAKTSLRAEYLALGDWTRHRKEVAQKFLEELLRLAKETGSDTVQITRVEASDPMVIQTLQDLGFERISTHYTMRRTFG